MVNIPTVTQFLPNSVRFLYVSSKMRLPELQRRLEHGSVTFAIYLNESRRRGRKEKSEIKNTSRNFWYCWLFGFTQLYRPSEIRKRHCLRSMYKSDTWHMPA